MTGRPNYASEPRACWCCGQLFRYRLGKPERQFCSGACKARWHRAWQRELDKRSMADLWVGY